jgi:hypothetical protein
MLIKSFKRSRQQVIHKSLDQTTFMASKYSRYILMQISVEYIFVLNVPIHSPPHQTIVLPFC